LFNFVTVSGQTVGNVRVTDGNATPSSATPDRSDMLSDSIYVEIPLIIIEAKRLPGRIYGGIPPSLEIIYPSKRSRLKMTAEQRKDWRKLKREIKRGNKNKED
jgi:hypothetical protein